jgi:hypothetical protein
MKPKIRYIASPYLFGIRFLPAYCCESKLAKGFGASAESAYRAWQADMPKTMIGRIVRRTTNYLFDAIVGSG